MDDLTYSELRNRVLSGYAYTIRTPPDLPNGKRSVTVMTGKGGVLLFIDVFEEKGIPASIVAEFIICSTDVGDYPLSVLKVKQTNASDKDK